MTATDERHEDELDEAERRYRSGYMQPNFSVFVGALPAAVFFVANRFATTEFAIAASFAVSVWVFIKYPGSGVIRALSTLSFAIVAGAAVVGLVLSSDKAFVAQNLIGDFAIAAISVASVLIRRPMIGAIAREMVPAMKPVMALDHPVFVQLTLLNGAINLGTGIVRIFMLDAMSANAYLVISRVAFWPLSVAFFLFAYRQITRTAVRVWPVDMAPPPQWRERGE